MRAGADEATLAALLVTTCEEGSALLGETCAICLGAFEQGDSLKALPSCVHILHSACIDEWLRVKACCPLCKAGVAA